ncbi:MarR family transcriptional regulator [Streptomyces sp. NBC_01335]|uniref:MarR family transcriptional regulator n=1 Tax=Streptomyces sp. NBC_01335 TaxID=2903828 RepID=UPI002E136A63|nr:MarR family transcriptional regulator [Streptomyces sp. NBC_01335]
MEYSHGDAELVEQPIGYWSWAAHKAVVTNIRAGLAKFGVTQPQWWVLNQVAADENGRTRAQVTTVLQGYLDVGASLANEIDALLGLHLLTLDGEDRLRLTSEGDTVLRRCAQRQTAMRKQAHDGITDEEYLVTLKVLQRMIHNVGGEAWHH